jgi:hypothetical protein
VSVLDANTRLLGARKRMDGEHAPVAGAPSVADCQNEVKQCEDRRHLRDIIQGGIWCVNALIPQPEEQKNPVREQKKAGKKTKKTKMSPKDQKKPGAEQKKLAEEQKMSSLAPAVCNSIAAEPSANESSVRVDVSSREISADASAVSGRAAPVFHHSTASTYLIDLASDLSLVRTFLHCEQKELRRQQKSRYQEKNREQLKVEIRCEAINGRNAKRLAKGLPREPEFKPSEEEPKPIQPYVPPPQAIQRLIDAWNVCTALLIAQVNDFGTALEARLDKLKFPIVLLGPDWDELKDLLAALRGRLKDANRQYDVFGAWRQPYGPTGIREQQKKTAEEQQKTADEQKKTADEQKKTADEQKKTADEQKKTADEQKKTADEQKKTADEQKKTADEQKKTADEHKNLGDECKRLAEEQKKTADEHKNLGDECKRLTEEQKKLREECKTMADELKKLADEWKKLIDAQKTQGDEQKMSQSEPPTPSSRKGAKRSAPDAESAVTKRRKEEIPTTVPQTLCPASVSEALPNSRSPINHRLL